MATAVELQKTQTLVAALESENRQLAARVHSEKNHTAILTELNDARRSEIDALRATIIAKNQTITAKDAVIASQEQLVEALKHKKPSVWRRVGDLLLGAAAIAVLK